jgi:hypothetical protein
MTAVLEPVSICGRLGDESGLPTSPPNARLHRDQPGRIVRSDYLRWSSLEPARRAALLDQLYRVYSATVSGYTNAEFAHHFFGSGEICVALHYGERDELAGFAYASIERIKHAGRTHAVFNAGVFCLLGYRGGASCAVFGLRQALRFKLREPRTPLAYVTRSSSPAAYRLIAATMPTVYPSRRHQTPADVEALVCAISAQRQYVPAGENPWVMRTPAKPHDSSRLRRLDDDPDVRFYNELNPLFAEGNSVLTWIPLTARNIVGGLFRALRARSA